MRDKKASSQASWSILAEGTSAARVQTHLLAGFHGQLVAALENCHPEVREEVYRICGDALLGMEKVLPKLARHLDTTNYALISMGGDFYRQRLTHEDREKVDLAARFNPTPSAVSIKKVSERYMAKAR